MRTDAIFIGVEVDDSLAADSAAAAKLEEVCPVDIYAASDSGLGIVEGNLDECVLCKLCYAVGPEGAVKVHKLYEDDAVL